MTEGKSLRIPRTLPIGVGEEQKKQEEKPPPQ